MGHSLLSQPALLGAAADTAVQEELSIAFFLCPPFLFWREDFTGNSLRPRAKQQPPSPGNRGEKTLLHGKAGCGVSWGTGVAWWLRDVRKTLQLQKVKALINLKKYPLKHSKISSTHTPDIERSWTEKSSSCNCSLRSPVLCDHKESKTEQFSSDGWNKQHKAVTPKRWCTAGAGTEKGSRSHQKTWLLLKAGMLDGTGGSTQLHRDEDSGVLSHFENQRE